MHRSWAPHVSVPQHHHGAVGLRAGRDSGGARRRRRVQCAGGVSAARCAPWCQPDPQAPRPPNRTCRPRCRRIRTLRNWGGSRVRAPVRPAAHCAGPAPTHSVGASAGRDLFGREARAAPAKRKRRRVRMPPGRAVAGTEMRGPQRSRSPAVHGESTDSDSDSEDDRGRGSRDGRKKKKRKKKSKSHSHDSQKKRKRDKKDKKRKKDRR